jgi:hypothetical protein
MKSQLVNTTNMACGVCNKNIGECTCPDIDKRLAELGGPGGMMIFRVDKKCGKHFARCDCEDPFWTYSDTGEEFVEANEMERS